MGTQDDEDDDAFEVNTPPATTRTSAPSAAPVVAAPAVAATPATTTPAAPAVPVTETPNQQSNEQLDQLRQILANIQPAGKDQR